MNAPEKVTPIHAGGGADDGTQRNMLALENVEYLITAEVRTTCLDRRPEHQSIKYCREIERRARGGKCFHRPAFGVREFAADFEWESSADAALDRRCNELGADLTRFNEDLGLILYDVFDWQERQDGFRWLREDEQLDLATQSPSNPNRRSRSIGTKEKQLYAGLLVRPQAAFFHARMVDSKIDCHPERIRLLTATDGGKQS
jgi:CRISPR-associated protein Cas5d